MNYIGFKMEMKVHGLHSMISTMKSDINVPLPSFLESSLSSSSNSFFSPSLHGSLLNKYKTYSFDLCSFSPEWCHQNNTIQEQKGVQK